MYLNYIYLVFVAFLWGATNPFIRRGSIGIEKIHSDSTLKKLFAEFQFLIFRWQYLIPFCLNQCGSILYFFTLQDTELSIAVPVANSLSFIFTAISALILGERKSSWNTYIGMLLVMAGTTICMLDKVSSSSVKNN